MTRVFFDARFAVRGLGIATASNRLLSALSQLKEIELRENFSRKGWTPAGKRETIRKSGLLDVVPALDPRTWKSDVLHYFGNTGPRLAGSHTIITVHDLIAANRQSLKHRLYASLLLPALRPNTRCRVVCVSSQTADDLVGRLPHLTGKIEVISHGYRPGLFSGAPRSHIMMFGGESDARKRIQLGLTAYQRYAYESGGSALPLAVVGRAGIRRESISALVPDAEVQFHEDPDGHTVDNLIATAACLIYASAEEGFGLPIVEAGEFGTPVVLDGAARIPAEPCGDHVFRVRDATSIDEWAQRINEACENGPVPNAITGLQPWSGVAADYATLYGDVAR